MPSIASPIGTPILAHDALPILSAPALTIFGILPGISIPPETSNDRIASRARGSVILWTSSATRVALSSAADTVLAQNRRSLLILLTYSFAIGPYALLIITSPAINANTLPAWARISTKD